MSCPSGRDAPAVATLFRDTLGMCWAYVDGVEDGTRRLGPFGNMGEATIHVGRFADARGVEDVDVVASRMIIQPPP